MDMGVVQCVDVCDEGVLSFVRKMYVLYLCLYAWTRTITRSGALPHLTRHANAVAIGHAASPKHGECDHVLDLQESRCPEATIL